MEKRVIEPAGPAERDGTGIHVQWQGERKQERPQKAQVWSQEQEDEGRRMVHCAPLKPSAWPGHSFMWCMKL